MKESAKEEEEVSIKSRRSYHRSILRPFVSFRLMMMHLLRRLSERESLLRLLLLQGLLQARFP